MRRFVLALLVQLALVPGAFAAPRFDDPPVSPSTPIAGEEIAARVILYTSCVIPPISVTTVGSRIDLRYQIIEDCSGPQIDMPVKVPLGTLSAGTYRMQLAQLDYYGQPQLEDEARFTVAPAAGVPGTARFAEPPVDPFHPIAGAPVEARVILPIACEVPLIAVVPAGSVIELRYERPEIDCPVQPTDTLFAVPLGTLPAGIYDLRLLEVSDPASPQLKDEAIFGVAEAPCEGTQGPAGFGPAADQGPPTLCLADGRFAVTVEWTAHDGTRGFGTPRSLTGDSGAFWFFDDDNLELLVKVIDACDYNGRFWVFVAGVTNVGVVVRVRDVATGNERTYTHAPGELFATVGDTGTFGCFLL